MKRTRKWLRGKRRITYLAFSRGCQDALDHVLAIFAQAQIEPIIEGSGHGNDIAVFDADVEKAVALLSTDPEAKRFEIIVYDP